MWRCWSPIAMQAPCKMPWFNLPMTSFAKLPRSPRTLHRPYLSLCVLRDAMVGLPFWVAEPISKQILAAACCSSQMKLSFSRVPLLI